MAYNHKQIEHYTKKRFKGTKDQCVPMANFARQVAEKDGFIVKDGHEIKNRKPHRYLILERDDQKWEILH